MLDLKKISVNYGNLAVLKDFDASVERGSVTCVIGTNGCGKSTLLKSIVGILPLSKGEILLDGTPLSQMSGADRAKKISYLEQGKATPDMSVFQLVLHGRFPYLSYPRRYSEKDRSIALSALEQVGLSDFADRPLCSLSGGMRQNAYIAMALAQNTDFLLLDEPTTYLDISHQLDLMKLLRRLADNGKGILAVMHDLPLAFDFSDKVVLISNGSALLQAPPCKIANSPELTKLFGVNLRFSKTENRFFYDF